MKCHNCKKQGTIFQHKNRCLCTQCFSELLEKRIRKYTRINHLFAPHDKVLVHDDISRFFIKSISKSMPLEIYGKKQKSKKINKEIIQWTADDESSDFLSSVFKNKKIREKFNKSRISILLPITDKEAEIFANLHKLSFWPNKKDKTAEEFMGEIEKRSPGAGLSFARNIGMLKRIIK